VLRVPFAHPTTPSSIDRSLFDRDPHEASHFDRLLPADLETLRRLAASTDFPLKSRYNIEIITNTLPIPFIYDNLRLSTSISTHFRVFLPFLAVFLLSTPVFGQRDAFFICRTCVLTHSNYCRPFQALFSTLQRVFDYFYPFSTISAIFTRFYPFPSVSTRSQALRRTTESYDAPLVLFAPISHYFHQSSLIL
jgi:hypothetical protein